MYILMTYGITCGKPFGHIVSAHMAMEEAETAMDEFIALYSDKYVKTENNEYICVINNGCGYTQECHVAIKTPAFYTI